MQHQGFVVTYILMKKFCRMWLNVIIAVSLNIFRLFKDLIFSLGCEFWASKLLILPMSPITTMGTVFMSLSQPTLTFFLDYHTTNCIPLLLHPIYTSSLSTSVKFRATFLPYSCSLFYLLHFLQIRFAYFFTRTEEA